MSEKVEDDIHFHQVQFKLYYQLYLKTQDLEYKKLYLHHKKIISSFIWQKRRERLKQHILNTFYFTKRHFRRMYKFSFITAFVLVCLLTPFPQKENTNISSASTYNESITEAEQLLVARSALYQYVKFEQKWPESVDELIKPYPENYITQINPYLLYQQKTYNGTNDYTLEEKVEKAFNLSCSCRNVPFEPIHIIVDKSKHQLFVLSGDEIIRSYPIAIGKKETPTPTGTFSIERKVVFEKENPSYGVRALELSDPTYAIHGTKHENSIGDNVSHGCIRLKNEDITELYSLVPLHTTVQIQNKTNLLPIESISNPQPIPTHSLKK